MANSDTSKYLLLTGRRKRHLSLVGFVGFFLVLIFGIGKRKRSTGFVLQLEPLLHFCWDQLKKKKKIIQPNKRIVHFVILDTEWFHWCHWNLKLSVSFIQLCELWGKTFWMDFGCTENIIKILVCSRPSHLNKGHFNHYFVWQSFFSTGDAQRIVERSWYYRTMIYFVVLHLPL